ncbi:MAG: hypothetical protein GX763_03550 [Clostridiaceae bacterium]|nr:hypothetical protein [Clostridiaceae bacterium]
MSELDSKRREHLLQIVSGHQVFMTGTDKEHMFDNEVEAAKITGAETKRPINYYYVKAGKVTPV